MIISYLCLGRVNFTQLFGYVWSIKLLTVETFTAFSIDKIIVPGCQVVGVMSNLHWMTDVQKKKHLTENGTVGGESLVEYFTYRTDTAQ